MPYAVVIEAKDEDVVHGPFRTRPAAIRWAEENVPTPLRWWIARFISR